MQKLRSQNMYTTTEHVVRNQILLVLNIDQILLRFSVGDHTAVNKIKQVTLIRI